jgi:hypothetical protein
MGYARTIGPMRLKFVGWSRCQDIDGGHFTGFIGMHEDFQSAAGECLRAHEARSATYPTSEFWVFPNVVQDWEAELFLPITKVAAAVVGTPTENTP